MSHSADELLDALMLLESDEAPTPPLNAEECVTVLEDELPGFWWRGGTCSLSSEVIIAPDHNCPEHGERLRREFPPDLDHWNEGIEVEYRPGSQAAFCRAFLATIIRVKLAKLGLFPEPTP